MNIKGQSFLKLLDFTPEQIMEFLALAAKLKAKKKAGIPHRLCEGKQAALIFEKTSTRTRCSFEVAAHDLGMTVTYLDPSGSQIGKKESIADTARVLGRMYDGIEYRGYGQQIVEDLAKYAGVPVWNGLTNEFHPTQILADFLTIQEHFGNLPLGGGICPEGKRKHLNTHKRRTLSGSGVLFYSASGRRTVKVLPSPIRLSTVTEPPWSRAACCTMNRPRPLPSLPRAASTW